MAHTLQLQSAYLALFNQNNAHFKMNVYECKYNVKEKKIWQGQLACLRGGLTDLKITYVQLEQLFLC